MKDMKKAIDHLKNHQTYPATKQELMEECNSLSDFSAEEKTWFEKRLEDKTYYSADEVLQEIGMAKQHMGQMA